MTMYDGSAERRPQAVGRLGLYLPTGLLVLCVLAWSGFWLYAKNLAEQRLADWTRTEAGKGRIWQCAGQEIRGYPFRIELHCSSVSLATGPNGSELRVQSGALHAATQVYSPKLILADVTGPLVIRSGEMDAKASWEALRISVRAGANLERMSLVAKQAHLVAARVDGEAISPGAKTLELHARIDPSRTAEDGSVDIALRITDARIPALDVLTGSSVPADLDLSGTATKASTLSPQDWKGMLEDWRTAGGVFTIERGRIAKGATQIEGNGVLGLDAARRVQGRLDVSGKELGPIISRFAGTGVNRLVAPLLQNKDGSPTKWPVRLQDGRILAGPLRSEPVLKPLY